MLCVTFWYLLVKRTPTATEQQRPWTPRPEPAGVRMYPAGGLWRRRAVSRDDYSTARQASQSPTQNSARPTPAATIKASLWRFLKR